MASELPWLYRAAVLRATREVVAREQGAVRCLGSTSQGNAASQGVLARLGFVQTGEQMDEVDGLEWVFTLDLEDPRSIR